MGKNNSKTTSSSTTTTPSSTTSAIRSPSPPRYFTPPSPTLLKKPWRVIQYEDRDELQEFVRKYKPDGAQHLRILIYGPVGAGKSSFINSAGAVITGHQCNTSEANASNETTSFTMKYKTHQFMIRGTKKIKIPIVFNDIMGLEDGDSRGVLPDDVELAMEGHVKDGYIFDTTKKLKENNKYFRKNPSINDKVHVLVCMLNADAPSYDKSVIKKMKGIREAARDLGIPQVAVATHIDGISEDIEENITNVFISKNLKEKIDWFSALVGIPVINIFPVINNYEGPQKKEAETLMLTALKHMVNYGDGFIDDQECDSGTDKDSDSDSDSDSDE